MNIAELKQYFTATWTETVRKSRTSLDPDDRETVDNFRKWDHVEDWLLTGAPLELKLIRPALGHLCAFTEYFQTNLGPGLDASYLCGSVACLLQLVSRMKGLKQVTRMIKTLVLQAESFNIYCTILHVADNMLTVCFDIQLQFVEFFTESIKLKRRVESGKRECSAFENGIRSLWQTATSEIKGNLSRLEHPVSMGRLDKSRLTTEMPILRPAPQQRCMMMPSTKISRIFDRVDVFQDLDELLALEPKDHLLSVVILYGLGGVGKSTIASSYAEKKFYEGAIDYVLWICGEKDASMRQSFTDVAKRLKLPGAQSQSHNENLVLVQDWLQATEYKWLVVYDNVESEDMLRSYWLQPSRHGRAIITTRNRAVGFELSATSYEITSWDAETGAEFLFFLLRKNIGRDMNSENDSALTLSEKVSGHALALSHMAGLIHNGEFSIQEFTAKYLENPGPAHVMQSLARNWNLVFQSLDTDGFWLLGVISFLMPDNIPPEIFEPDDDKPLPPELEFLRVPFSFDTARTQLITLALVKRNKDTRVLMVHRLVQIQFRYFLSPEQHQKMFDNTVTLLSYIVPKIEAEKGQLYDEWEMYNRYLQHVLNLRDIFTEEKKRLPSLNAPKEFCEALKAYQRYLYENCSFEECEKTCAVNLAAVSTFKSEEDKLDLQGTIISHQAQVYDALGDPHRAMVVCQQEIDLRLGESPKKFILLSYSTGNLGNMHCSANEFEKALEFFKESRKWWAAHFDSKGESRRFGASLLVNEARCLIGLKEFGKAEEMLDITVKQVKEEKPLNFGTLAFAHFCQGTLDRCQREFESAEAHFMEAQNVWLKGDQGRIHPFNAAIMFKIGACCLDQGKIEASIKHIKDSIDITKLYRHSMPIEHGRNLFKLSEAMLQNGDNSTAEAIDLREEAACYLKKKKPEVAESGIESAYDDLIPINWK